MASKTYYVLGLMSGSSLDGLVIAYCNITWDGDRVTHWKLLESETLPFSDKWKNRLRELPNQNGLIFAKTNTYFGHYMGGLVNEFIENYRIKELDFIASHGHTIFHDPEHRISIQIGDGAALASQTGYTTICDFRTQDVAMDGEGAPLSPLADRYMFHNYDFYLNIGGIANVSANTGNDNWVAMDCCAANQVLNLLAEELGSEFDNNGSFASRGSVNEKLLGQVSDFSYYSNPYPKSMSNGWIREKIIPLYREAECSSEDKLATACEHIAIEISNSIQDIINKEGFIRTSYKMLLTGGGVFNNYLVQTIHAYCNRSLDIDLLMPDASIINFKEAMLMALLGVLRVEKVPNSMKAITGAKMDTINGAIHVGYKSVKEKEQFELDKATTVLESKEKV